MFWRSMSLALVVTLVGCGDDEAQIHPPNTTMTTEGYSKTCMASTDCTLVFVGNVCGCACTQEAIATTEQSRYSLEQEQMRKGCTDILSCQPCPETQAAACTQSMCTVVPK